MVLIINSVMILVGLVSSRIMGLSGEMVMLLGGLVNNQRRGVCFRRIIMRIMVLDGVIWIGISREIVMITVGSVGIVVYVERVLLVANGLLILGMMIMDGVIVRT